MNTPGKHLIQNPQGFTLIEVMIAIVILTIGVLTLVEMQITSIRTNFRANNITAASNWATDRIERLVNSPYDCKPVQTGCHAWDDVDGDGTTKDTDGDGVDGSGNNFGLDDAAAATADRWETSPDGQYTIFWNVAVDVPIQNCKTLRVTVARQAGTERATTMTYIKAKK